MKKLACLLLALSSGAAAASEPMCGRNYIVGATDTLSTIALAVYGDASRWREIYVHGRNSVTVGLDPNALTEGAILELPPCEDVAASIPIEQLVAIAGAGAPDAVEPAGVDATSRETARAETDGPPLAVVEVLSGSGNPPFTGDDETAPGLVTEIVRAAFRASGLENPVEIVFIDDWPAHTRALLKRRKYALGAPWSKPPCDELADIHDGVRARCEYVYSDPIHVAAIQLYAPKSDPAKPTAFAELAGHRVCRSQSWRVFALERHGLLQPSGAAVTDAGNVLTCFELLEKGHVDYVFAPRFPAEDAIARLELQPYVAMIDEVVEVHSLHLIAHRDYEEAAFLWLKAFNRGLAMLRETGELDRIAARRIEAFRKGRPTALAEN